jgi:hypothetical protein
MSVDTLDILTIRKTNVEVVVRFVEPYPGDWRVYKWEQHQCLNWTVTLGRRFASRSDALSFIQNRGYVISETRTDNRSASDA